MFAKMKPRKQMIPSSKERIFLFPGYFYGANFKVLLFLNFLYKCNTRSLISWVLP